MKNRFFKTLSLILSIVLIAGMTNSAFADYNSERKSPEFKLSELNPNFVSQNYRSFGSTKDKKNRNGYKFGPLKIFFDDKKKVKSSYGNRQNTLPEAFDLRDEGKLTPIRNQGPNGSCWAFATYASLESTLLPETRLDFSEKHMRNTHGYDWGPNDGGNREMSTSYLARWDGPIDEADDPYTPNGFYSPRNLERIMDLQHVRFIPDKTSSYDLEGIKRAVYDNGALFTTILGSDEYVNFKTMGYYFSGGTNADHAVAIVGWDDNYSRRNFLKDPGGNGAFLVKNSWGANWGTQGGYYWVSYHDVHIGNHNAQYFAREKGRSNVIYQYDELGATSSGGYGSSNYFANVFGPSDVNEWVNSVGFWSVEENTRYEVFLVTDYENTDSFQDKIKVASGRLTYAGYHVIDFDPVKIAKGKKFAPVVYINGKVAIEKPFRNFSSRARAQNGQSYISSNGRNWSDVNKESRNTNVCLKAMSTTVAPEGEEQDVRVSSVKLNKSRLTMNIGDVETLVATITPRDASNKNLTWSSSNRRVLSVDADGKIEALRAGTATITVKTEDGSYTDTIRVTVKEKEEEVSNAKITLNRTKLELEKGDYSYLYARVTGDVSSRTVEYKSSDEKVVTVSRYGTVRAIGSGRAVITASSDNGKISAKCEVVVKGEDKPNPEPKPEPKPDVKEEKLTIDLSTAKSIYTLGDTIYINGTVKDQDNKAIKYETVNLTIITPDNREVELSRLTNYRGEFTQRLSSNSRGITGVYKVKASIKYNNKTYTSEHSFRLNSPSSYRKEKQSVEKIDAKLKFESLQRGETQWLSAKIIDKNSKAVSKKYVKIDIKYPGGREISYRKRTDNSGNLKFGIRTSTRTRLGVYKFTIEYGEAKEVKSFTITR